MWYNKYSRKESEGTDMKKNLLKKVKQFAVCVAAAIAVIAVPQAAMAYTSIDVTQTVIWSPDPNAYVNADGNSRYLSQSELYNYSNMYLLIARNEFYARHGYIFNDSNIARYFNAKNWYYGTTYSSQFSENVFNAYERYNINLIVQEENRRGSKCNTITWTTSSGNTGSSSGSVSTSIDVTQTVIWSPDPNASVIPDVNCRYISASELSNFSNLYLLIARNEIYAKHGYIFNDSNIGRYFNCKNWYRPTTYSSQFSESVFNAYEKANLNVIVGEENRRGSTVSTITWTR